MKTWKLQKFGGDVLYDLRSRGLLPVAGLLVVAIIAAPLLISQMGSSDEAPPPGDAIKSAAELAPEGQSAVLAYSPGLRNYRERLDKLAAKDPFVQQFSSGGGAAGALDIAEGSSGGSDLGGSTGSGGSNGSGGGSGSGGGGGTETFYFVYETDLRVGAAGSELQRRNRVAEFTLLPSEQSPALVFLGASSDGKQAIFSVSRSVSSVSGSGVCYPEPDSCELLGLRAGQGADLAYSGESYRVEVAAIRRVKSSNP